MKKYDARDVVLQRGVEWVPADVAQDMYDELVIMESILASLIEDGYIGYSDRRRAVRKALSKADKE